MIKSLISIIIPIYNVAQYLPKCLDSILAQTYKNLEIILVDDGSKDNSGKICDEYAKKDTRIKVIHQKNGGVAAARNTGLAIANGEWIGFLDSDDWIEQDMFEYLLNLTCKYDADIAQCGIFFEDNIYVKEIAYPEKEYFAPYGIEKFTNSDMRFIVNSVCNKLYRADIIKNIKFDTNYPIGEDLLFNIEIMLKIKGIAFGVLRKYHYLYYKDSASHLAPTLKKIESNNKVLEKICNLVKDNVYAKRYFEIEQLKDYMDMSSKIVRYYKKEFEPCKNIIQKNLREKTKIFLTACELTLTERTKLMLIAWCWRLYKVLLCARWKLR